MDTEREHEKKGREKDLDDEARKIVRYGEGERGRWRKSAKKKGELRGGDVQLQNIL